MIARRRSANYTTRRIIPNCKDHDHVAAVIISVAISTLPLIPRTQVSRYVYTPCRLPSLFTSSQLVVMSHNRIYPNFWSFQDSIDSSIHPITDPTWNILRQPDLYTGGQVFSLLGLLMILQTVLWFFT